MAPGRGFELVATEVVFAGRLFTVEVRTIDSPFGAVERHVVVHPGSVAVVPLDGEDIVMLRQYRAPVGEPLLEIPAGLLDVPGEDPAAAAARECAEEIGMMPGRLTLLTNFYNTPGYSTETTRLYLANDLVPVPARPHAPEEQAAEVVRMPLSEAVAMAAGGEISDGKTIIGVMLAAAGR